LISQSKATLLEVGNLTENDNAYKWTCIGSVDCLRLKTVRGKESIATNKPGLPTGLADHDVVGAAMVPMVAKECSNSCDPAGRDVIKLCR